MTSPISRRPSADFVDRLRPPQSRPLTEANVATYADRLQPLGHDQRCRRWVADSLRAFADERRTAAHIRTARRALLEGDPLSSAEAERHMFDLTAYADDGHAAAWTAIGTLFENAYGMRDLRRALSCFRKAADGNDPEGIMRFARLQAQTAATHAEKQFVVNEFARAFHLGQSEAASDIGAWIFRRGDAVLDPANGPALFAALQHASLLSGPAAFACGAAREFGALGTTADQRIALRAYRTAMLLGDRHAAFAFARPYIEAELPAHEVGGPRLVRALEDAGDVFDGRAHIALGDIHFYGKFGVPENDAKAMSAYDDALRLRNPTAAAMYGFAHLSGRCGFPQDAAKARDFFEIAAGAGDERGIEFLQLCPD